MDMNRAALHSLTCPVLIGRTTQLDTLLHLLEQSCAEQGQTAVIAGEAGIGKSRLIREALTQWRSSETQAAQAAALILHGSCFEQDSTLPYAPLLDLLRPFLAAEKPQTRIGSLPLVTPELVKLLPELGPLLPEPAPTIPLEPEQEKRRLHQALLDLFGHLAASQPLILILEDVHWSDASTLEFLLFLARRLTAHHILLLLTYRIEEEHPPLTRLLAVLSRERLATELQLSHLSRSEVAAMLRATLAQEHRVRSDLLDTVYNLTEGTPFFIEEVLKSLVTSGDLVAVEDRWQYRSPESNAAPGPIRLPRSVQLAVQQRLDHLSAEARDLLSLAAVAGRRFDFPLLQEATRRQEAQLVPLVKELVRAQLVEEEAEDRFVFRHALTRQAVYTDLLARERRAWHRLLAETLERLYAGAPEAHLSALAYHWYAAREWSKVLLYAQRAGEAAQGFYAPHAAIEQYSHAIEAARHLAQLPPLTLYRARGQCYELLGDFEAARADYTRALQVARETQDAVGEWQSLFDLGYLWTGREYEQAGHYLQQALARARAMRDPLTLARTLNRVGNWYANMEKPEEGLGYHQEALAIFQGLADQHGLAETYDLLAIASYNIGGPITAIAYYEQAILRWRALNERQGLVFSLTMMAVRSANYLNLAGVWVMASPAECLRDGEEALAIARQLGWRSAEALALIFLGIGLGPRGEYARALTCAQDGLEIATEIEHEPWMGFAHLLLGILALDLLALPTARHHLEQALSLAKKMSYLFLLRVASGFLALTCVSQQDFTGAETLLEPEFNLKEPPRTAVQRLVWYAQAELKLARSNPEATLEIVDRIIASATAGEHGGVIPYVWHVRARALVALNRIAEAEAAMLEARTMALAHEARPILWRLQVALGKLYQSQGRNVEAEEIFSAARATIEEVAATLPEGLFRDHFLRGTSSEFPLPAILSPRRAARQSFDGLTEREREVAALIAQGKSNRAAADELVVSERTIAKHVENILSKLGFRSRAQIAAWSVEKGLTSPPV